MEVITNELWLLLPDKRLISMNKHQAQAMVFAGEAELVDPSRVERVSPHSFALRAEATPVEAATVAAPERAASTKPGARTPG